MMMDVVVVVDLDGDGNVEVDDNSGATGTMMIVPTSYRARLSPSFETSPRAQAGGRPRPP